MDFLSALWLPILISAAAVWVVAAVVWMALPHHKNDYIALPDEEGFMEAVRRLGIKPGNYVFPDFRKHEAMKTERVSKALEEGPVGHLSLWQPPLGMAGKMVGTFVLYLVVSTLIAYLASIVLPRPAEFARVFQVVGIAGVLAYCFSFVPTAIWFGSYKRTIAASVFDGLLYGAMTGAIFAWRWPH